MFHWLLISAIFITCLHSQVYSATPFKPSSFTCPPGQWAPLPNPSDCSTYYLCAYGVPRLILCSAGLEFNANTNMCDVPSVSRCAKQCDALLNDAGGTWDPPSCTKGPNDIGAKCSIQCVQDYELRGSAYIECTEFGWNSTNGNFIPKCLELECLSQSIKNQINETLAVKAGMLFVLDESGSIGKTDFLKSLEFVKSIVKEFPLSSTRSAGVITFSDYPVTRISLTESSTTSFNMQVDNINYRDGGTDVLEALEAALQEINIHHTKSLYLVFLITDGISETEATPAANAIKKADHPLFTIGVGQTRLQYVESLSSMGKNGVRHFFHTRSFEILENIGHYMNQPVTSTNPKSKCP